MVKPSFRCKQFKSPVYCEATLFLITAFKSKHWYYTPIVKRLLKQGFNVYVYDYPSRPLLNCQPQEWVNFTHKLNADIQKRIHHERKIYAQVRFGIIGVSMGSTLALHAAKCFSEVEKMVFVTLYGSSAQLVWENKVLKKIKKKFTKAELTMHDAFDTFGPLEATTNLQSLGQRPILMFASMDDQVIRYSNTNLFLKAANDYDLNLSLRVVNHTRHSLAVAKIMRQDSMWAPFLQELRNPTLVGKYELSNKTPSKAF